MLQGCCRLARKPLAHCPNYDRCNPTGTITRQLDDENGCCDTRCKAMPGTPYKAPVRRPPRLALIVTDVYAFNVLGRGQLEYIADQKVQLDLYCGGSQQGLDVLRQRRLGRVTKVALRREPSPALDLLALGQLLFYLIIRRYDGVVFSTPKALLLGSLASAIGHQRYRVALVRGRAYENFVGMRRKVYVWLDRIAFSLAHRVVFISRSQHLAYMADNLAAHISPQDAVVGHGSSNGVNINRFRPLPSDERARLREGAGLSTRDFVILVVGRITPDKGTAFALRLMQSMRDVDDLVCIFVGDFEDEELRRQIKNADDPRIRHQPACANVEDWFALADVNFVPSLREGFGNVAIEAAASGLLTLAFDVVGMRDSVKDGVSGRLFALGDVAAVEAEVRRIMNNRLDLRARGQHARRWAAERFAQETTWSNYLSLFLPDHFANPS